MTHNESDSEFSEDFDDDYYDNYDLVAEAAKEQEDMFGFVFPIDATPDALPLSTPSLQQLLISEPSSTSFHFLLVIESSNIVNVMLIIFT